MMTQRPLRLCRGRCGRLLLSALLSAGMASLALAEPYRLPDFGSSAERVMSAPERRELGNEFMKWVRKGLPVTQDPVLADYIETIGAQLVAAGGHTGHYEFFLIDQPTINAFAGPDGYIGVYAGLLLATQTEGELAAVLAHEIAHISQDHLMRAFEAQKQMTLPTVALMLAAAVLGASVDPNLGAAALAGAQGLAAQRQINFTRGHEEEADRIGIDTLARGGYDPFAMPGFFQRLSKATQVAETGLPAYLRTHPVTADRIGDALGRAGQYGTHQRPDSLRFQLARANLRQRSYSRAEKAIEHFEETLASGRFREATAERYGYALALARGGKAGEALAQVAQLLASHPSQTEFLVLRADIDRLTGNAAKAAAELKGPVGLYPENWPLNQAYGEALLAAGRPTEALAALERFSARRPDLAPIYQLMADAAGKAGLRAKNFRYRGEYLARTGDLEPAIRQLELALRVPGLDFNLASRIQVRLEELRAAERLRDKDKDKNRQRGQG